MADVKMYTTTFCPFCTRARKLLQHKGVRFEDINLDEAPQRRAEMMERAGGRHSVPQVFIDGKPYGGFDDLTLLDRQGKLDSLLGMEARA